MPESMAARATELRNRLRDAIYHYFILEQPDMTDAEYDALFRELVELEELHPELVTPDSPTRTVGTPLQSSFATVTHPTPMLSLDNAFGAEEVDAFAARVRRGLGTEGDVGLLCEPKVDGLSVNLLYRSGEMVWAATRGNGRQGEDVSANILNIAGIPRRLRGAPAELEVRGEVYMPRSEFARINREREELGEPLFMNPRNAASGALRQVDPRITYTRRLDVFLYDIGRPEQLGVATRRELLNWLAAAGFRTNPLAEVTDSMEATMTLLEGWREIRTELDYDTDGVVLKVNRIADAVELGSTSRAPRWAIAWKFPAEEVETTLESITVQVGRTGKITPVANLEPQLLEGTLVGRATLHNPGFVELHDLRAGDRVLLHKSGGIIPEIIRNLDAGTERPAPAFVFPVECPSCGEQLVMDGANLKCLNPGCPAQLRQRLVYFASRAALDIEGMGESTVSALVDAGLVHAIEDIFVLQAEDVAALPGFAVLSAANLTGNIDAARTKPLAAFITGLGLPHVGRRTAEVLARHFPSLEALAAASEEQLTAVPDVGPTTAAAIVQALARPQVVATITALRERGVEPAAPAVRPADEQTLAGVTVVITGTLSVPRNEVKERLEAHGATVTGSVSKRTTVLVAGSDAGSKLDKAQALGVRVIGEEELEELLAGGLL